MNRLFFLISALLTSTMIQAQSEFTFTPNQPIGEAKGICPGRVTLVRDPKAALWDGHTSHWWDEGNINQDIVEQMFCSSIRILTGGCTTSADAWKRLFIHFNSTHGRHAEGYKPGEKIVVKINLNNTHETNDRDNDIDQSSQGLIALLHQLVDSASVNQSDIILYDASIGFRARAIPDRIRLPVSQLFPQVKWMSANGSDGVEAAHWVDNAITYTDNHVRLGNSLPREVVGATYLINLALLKGHEIAGVTLCAKNHFGSIQWPFNEHNSTSVSQFRGREGDYNALVDLMGCPNLGGKTLLCIIEGLYGMQTNVGGPKINRDTWNDVFGGGWSSCYLMSEDPVAIEAVGLDLLYAEFGGELGYSGAPAFPKGSSVNCDNYLKEAAKGHNTSKGAYRPNGVEIGSLGVFEHWNNANERKYSRNLGTGKGIELIETKSVSENPTMEINAVKDESKNIAPSITPYIDTVRIKVDTQKKIEPMKHIWAWVGYDEPNYTYMPNGQKLLTELSEMSPVPVYVRAHNLLCTGDGTPALKWGSTNVYTETKRGKAVYDWTLVDSIIDRYIERGMKPLMEIGFMPEALSTHPQPYQHHWRPDVPYNEIYTGWTFPPRDYDKWRELVYQWVRHSVERYGKEEVETWYWEVWNEPDIGYWSGSHEEYCKLYDYAADGLKKALPTARIGGPETTDPSNRCAGEYLRKFLEHCLRETNYATGKVGSPLEYISFHAKGAPRVINEHVQMNIGRQLNNINRGFEIIASFPELKSIPVVIGESDPEGCAACSVDFNPQNGYRDGTMYASYTAAAFARKYELARRHGINFIGAVSWAFEFEGQPMFAGFRELASGGIDKPVLNVMRMYGMMGGDMIETESSDQIPTDTIIRRSVRRKADISSIATIDNESVAVMVANYHDDDVKSDTAFIKLSIDKLNKKRVLVNHYRIDDDHSNAYKIFKQMGSPQQLTSEQYAELEKKGQLELLTSPQWYNTTNGTLNIEFRLPRQGVSLLIVR